MQPGKLEIDGTAFRDEYGRHVILRGLNFGGDSKLPVTSDAGTWLPTDFASHRAVSFVGRPAPLEDIDSHFARMRHWGFNCLRFLTTWEAVEHQGPGHYDEAYLDYIAEVCARAGKHGLQVFIDFHQDVWSRMSGGDGAPGWTFEAAGLDFTKFHVADAALLMQHNYDYRLGGRQASYPTMAWGSNYARPANGIMWTLFFAGADLAPAACVDGVSVQHYLQDHFLGAMHAVAERVAHLENVIGFDTLNEPGSGYIGKSIDQPIFSPQGPMWSPLDGLAVASGHTRLLPVFRFGEGIVGTQSVNESGTSIWLPGRDDPFRINGAWDIDASNNAVVLEANFFQQCQGREIDLERDCMAPFFNRVAETVRSVRDDWLVFAELDPIDAMKGHGYPAGMPPRTVNASHWYDISALMTKQFDPGHQVHILTGEVRESPQAIEDGHVRELGVLSAAGDALNGGAPTLIGECGIPYDMNGAASYEKWQAGEREPGIWAAQTAALDLMYNAFDRLLLSSAQWNYTVSNRNDPMKGDGWNQEDLSIWSIDQTIPGDWLSGGRAVEGFCRPYVQAAQGRIVRQRFDRACGTFEAVIDIDPSIAAPTQVFVPLVQFPQGYTCHIDPPAEEMRGSQGFEFFSPRGSQLTIRLARQQAAADEALSVEGTNTSRGEPSD